MVWRCASCRRAPVDRDLARRRGARVYFVENRELPMHRRERRLSRGLGVRHARRQSGLAGVTQRMLPLGAGGLSEDEIANRVADVGAQLRAASTSTARAGVRTLSSAAEREQALDVLAQVLQPPRFRRLPWSARSPASWRGCRKRDTQARNHRGRRSTPRRCTAIIPTLCRLPAKSPPCRAAHRARN